MTSERQSQASTRHLSGRLAVAAACVFIFLASYRIELPGLYYDEVAFVNAAQGAPDNTFIYKRLGPVPVLINPYTADPLRRHARHPWIGLGCHRRLDNGG